MLRAVIFDFNGILVNDEPIHLEMFRKVLKDEGISITNKDYYDRYLGMDDRGCFKAVFQDHGRKLYQSDLEKMIRRKAAYYRESMHKKISVFPGVGKLLLELSSSYPLAIASGALRSEIEAILESTDLRKHFQVIVSTEDVTEGKPNPEIFIKALSLLNQRKSVGQPIRPSQCLVVEDSKEGILGAHRAGIKCLAVTNSHPAAELTEAEAVVESLEQVNVPFLESLFKEGC
jgi:HAD superfamily hydrolase (TIGR01509 family)